MQTQQGLDRLAFFTDAVAAIAMTLLIVPLVELATASSDKEADTAAFLSENKEKLLAFVISFVVIAVLWVAHHRIFEQVAALFTRLARTHPGLGVHHCLHATADCACVGVSERPSDHRALHRHDDGKRSSSHRHRVGYPPRRDDQTSR